MLKLNRDKTEDIHVAGEYIEFSNNARNIGVIFYSGKGS